MGIRLSMRRQNSRKTASSCSKAVEQNVHAVRRMAPKQKADREIVFGAVKEQEHSLDNAASERKADHEFMLEVVQQNQCPLLFS